MTRRDRTEPRGESAGWRAFALGMVGMCAVIALWIALVETAEAPDAEMSDRPRATAVAVRSAE